MSVSHPDNPGYHIVDGPELAQSYDEQADILYSGSATPRATRSRSRARTATSSAPVEVRGALAKVHPLDRRPRTQVDLERNGTSALTCAYRDVPRRGQPVPVVFDRRNGLKMDRYPKLREAARHRQDADGQVEARDTSEGGDLLVSSQVASEAGFGRASSTRPKLCPKSVLALQRMAGNGAVGLILSDSGSPAARRLLRDPKKAAPASGPAHPAPTGWPLVCPR